MKKNSFAAMVIGAIIAGVVAALVLMGLGITEPAIVGGVSGGTAGGVAAALTSKRG